MTRDELVAGTQALIVEGERLVEVPSLAVLRDWLARSDRFLAEAWGSMDRWHLAWLMVGRPERAPRGRAMSTEEEADYARTVAQARTAVLRASLESARRPATPFAGEERTP